jgi:adenylate cyclase
VLKGSVQAVGKRLRLSFVLEEGASSEQLWAERYDRQLDDVFSLQDEIIRFVAASVRTSIKIRLFKALADADDATLAFPQLLDKAAGLFHQPSVETIRKALVTLRCALERAPDNSMASAMMGFGLYNVAERDALALTPEATREILTFLDRAVTLDPRSYVARAFNSIAVHDLRGDHRAAHELAAEALTRNATYIAAQGMLAISDIHLGHVAEGTQRLQEVMATSIDDASHSRHRRELAIAHWLNGKAAEGMRVAAKLWQEVPEIRRNAVVLAGLSAAAGELEEARLQIEALKAALPGITIATARLPRIGDAAASARFRDALVKAGL